MLPFGIQPIHIILIAIVALLIFGPSRLPEIGRGVGKMLSEFRKGAKEMTESFRDEVKQPDQPPAATIAPPQVSQPYTPPAAPMQTPPAESAASNFCIHCGKSNPVGAVYCNSCGNKIAE